MIMTGATSITTSDIVASAQGVRAHVDMLAKTTAEITPEAALGFSFKRLLRSDANGGGVLDDMDKKVNAIANCLSI